MSKSRDAFRTISEVSSALDTPAHVLRFWESKFSQVKPVKRAGGRRYYRPADVNLLAGIKRLLHEDGMTIKGAQKLLREKGVKHVAKLGEDRLQSAGAQDADITVDHTDITDTPAATPVPDVATQTTPVPASPPETAAKTSDDTPTNEQPSPAPTPQDALNTTNVVNLPPKQDNGPAVTLNPPVLKSKTPSQTPAPETTEPAPANVENTAPMAAPDVPADPSDSDSKAPARVFHLLQTTRRSKLAARRDEIAPLLDRMQVLRDRIATR